LTLDVSTSTGNGGRDWTNKTISVQGEGKSNITKLENYLKQTTFRVSPPMTIPAKLFKGGQTYYFLVTLCNFLNKCGQGKLRVTVLSNPLPSISIPGPAIRNSARNVPLSIKSYGTIQNCDGTTTSTGRDYSWTVSQNNVPVINIISQSFNPTILSIPAYKLSVGLLYDIQLTVTILSTLQSSKTLVQVYIQSGNLVPRIKGGSNYNIRFGDKALLLDGSQSYDENTNSAADLIFAWSCVETSPEYHQNCSRLFQPTDLWNQEILTLKPVILPYIDSTLPFVASLTMSIYDSDYTRSAKLAVTVNILTASTPLVLNLISNIAEGKMNGGDRLTLTGILNLPVGVTGRGQWSVDDSSFDLRSSTRSSTMFSFSSSSTVMNIQMSIVPNSVPVGATLTFSLTCELPSSSKVSASVTIAVNAPPQPGKFYVTPDGNNDRFMFISENWQDVNLPLMYQYGYLSPLNAKIIMRSLSEMTYASLALPAGNAIHCIAQIYDSVKANSSASFIIQVNKTTLNSNQIYRYIQNGFASTTNFNIDGIKQTILSLSILLNLLLLFFNYYLLPI
jgi:hypothetical protein